MVVHPGIVDVLAQPDRLDPDLERRLAAPVVLPGVRDPPTQAAKPAVEE